MVAWGPGQNFPSFKTGEADITIYCILSGTED